MKTETVFIVHIRTRCERIMKLTSETTYDTFCSDPDLQDIMIRSFLIIGEAVTHFSEEYITRHPEIMWKELRAFRNVLAHQYFRLDLREIWETAVCEIPELYHQILSLEKE